jgi:hypothetical protein
VRSARQKNQLRQQERFLNEVIVWAHGIEKAVLQARRLNINRGFRGKVEVFCEPIHARVMKEHIPSDLLAVGRALSYRVFTWPGIHIQRQSLRIAATIDALFQPTISHAAVVTSVGVRSAPQR